MDALVPIPSAGRTFSARRRIRLSDMDVHGRLRLDAVARYLQDVAIDDVDETGWGAPRHVWVIRSIRIDVLRPFLEDRTVELVTWCSGQAALAAGRRWSVGGDRGGAIEVDSVWIHLGPDGRPERLVDFGIYGEAAAGRRVSTKLTLADPPATAARVPWPLRLTDVDLFGHVNNATYWQAVEGRLPLLGLDPRRPHRARLDYRTPVDLADEVVLAEAGSDGVAELAFVTASGVKAVARLESLGSGLGRCACGDPDTRRARATSET
jgi:acyl-ACP thioesterase